MTPEAIHDFLQKGNSSNSIKIDLKKRNPVKGRFIKSNDYDDLRVKNFWRILPESGFQQWDVKQDNNLLKLFNGSDFTKLTPTS